MDPLTWFWFVLAVGVVAGMCLGAGINREYSRAYERRAQRSQALAQQLRLELEAAEQRALVASAERIATTVAPSPVVLNLHLSSLPQAWPQPPVLDWQIVPALEGGEHA